jgi:error-prone DNA polymerase
MQRMRDLEGKLRAGMTANHIPPATQEQIVQSISSFALYGFPESHAASFALIAYASAYFKVRYLAAFTCALMNNQPMGFYMPAVIVKDAQRHGLKVRSIDIQQSDWFCTLEHDGDGCISLRLGLMYAKGLRQQAAEAVMAARQAGIFTSAEDLALRVPVLNKKELTRLASIGALNTLGNVGHRRDALWQVEQAGRPAGPLLRNAAREPTLLESTHHSPRGQLNPECSPLRQMETDERLVADYSGTGLTVGRHPMAYRRSALRRQRIASALELRQLADGAWVRTAGCVIARQRPGTASGFIFLSMEDETGISNIFVHPDLYERERVLVSQGKFLLVEGKLQNEDAVVHVRADRIAALAAAPIEVRSHDFH